MAGNTSGRIARRYNSLAGGIPFLFHWATAPFVTWHSLATFTVPPSCSMIPLLMVAFMANSIESLYIQSQEHLNHACLMGCYRQQMEAKHRIREARKAAGLSQTALGEECGVTKSAVSQWELGLTEPSLSQLKRICDLTGFTADYIVRGSHPDDEAMRISRSIIALPPEKRALLKMIFDNQGPETKALPVPNPEHDK